MGGRQRQGKACAALHSSLCFSIDGQETIRCPNKMKQNGGWPG